MISNPRHGSPPRLMAHQPTRSPTSQESSIRVHRPEPVSGHWRPEGLAVTEIRPGLHDGATALEAVGAPIRPLHRCPDLMVQSLLQKLARKADVLAPGPKGRAQA